MGGSDASLYKEGKWFSFNIKQLFIEIIKRWQFWVYRFFSSLEIRTHPRGMDLEICTNYWMIPSRLIIHREVKFFPHFLFRILVFCDILVKTNVLKPRVAINWYYGLVIVHHQCKNGKLIMCGHGLCDIIRTSKFIATSILQNQSTTLNKCQKP